MLMCLLMNRGASSCLFFRAWGHMVARFAKNVSCYNHHQGQRGGPTQGFLKVWTEYRIELHIKSKGVNCRASSYLIFMLGATWCHALPKMSPTTTIIKAKVCQSGGQGFLNPFLIGKSSEQFIEIVK